MSAPVYLSPAETAKVLGVTPRALRVYEQRGLVTPLRTAVGWRAYGPAALAQLHRVLALKRLGLGLADIAVMLSGRSSSLEAILELQETVFAQRSEQAARGLRLVRAARERLALGEDLSLDDLITLTKETTMTEQTPDWAKLMQPVVDRHFNGAEKQAMRDKAQTFDQAKVGAEWTALIEKAKALVGTDPTAPEAQDLARRWRAQVNLATGGDTQTTVKLTAVWRDSMARPNVAPSLPFGPEVMAFVGQAMRGLGAA